MNHHERRLGRLRWRIVAGVIVVVAASTVALSQPAASPITARLTATSASATAGHSPAAGAADQGTADTGGPCPPNPTYPSSPTDQTQYGVPFTADILDGTGISVRQHHRNSGLVGGDRGGEARHHVGAVEEARAATASDLPPDTTGKREERGAQDRRGEVIVPPPGLEPGRLSSKD